MGETLWELQALLVKALREGTVSSEHKRVDFDKFYLAAEIHVLSPGLYDLENTGHIGTILTSSSNFLVKAPY